MTQQALVTFFYAASEMSLEEQAEFAQYLEKLLDEHYHPKEITITGKVAEAILENWEQEKATAK
jgi:hypothetical protein